MEHTTRTLLITIVITLIGFGSSDLTKDRDECANQLLTLSTCLPYVGGDSKAPTKECCKGFGQVIVKSEKCICVLIKDKDEPDLGIKFNATLAAHLPTICKITAPNISKCISLLQIPPNSTLAQEFERLGKIEGNTNTTAPSQNGKDGAGGGKAETTKSNGGTKNSLLAVELLIFALSFMFV